MTKVTADKEEKRKQGIMVLKQYRNQVIGREEISNSNEHSVFFKFKLPPHLEERQKMLRLTAYDRALNKAIRVEQDYHVEQHRAAPHKPASMHSRASLMELAADERISGVPESKELGFLADMLIRRDN